METWKGLEVKFLRAIMFWKTDLSTCVKEKSYFSFGRSYLPNTNLSFCRKWKLHSLTRVLVCLYSFITCLLTPCCRVLLEKLTGLQLVKKSPAFHGTRRFITALTSVRHLSLSWASPIQSIYPPPSSWRSILILSTHLRLGLPSDLSFPPVSPSRPYTPPSPHPYALHSQPITFIVLLLLIYLSAPIKVTDAARRIICHSALRGVGVPSHTHTHNILTSRKQYVC